MRACVTPRTLFVVVAALAALGLSPTARSAHAGGGDDPAPVDPATAEDKVREDPDHDFRWTVPPKWEFEDPSETDQAAGYVLIGRRAVSAGIEISAWVLVKDAAGLTIDALATQVKENKTKSLKDVKVEADSKAWAGSQSARAMRILGKAENGSTIVWFCRAAIINGKYHELDIRSSNGAHNDLQSEIDHAIAGYRVLSAPAPEEGGGGEGETPTPAGDAFTKRFPNVGLSWTLPAPGKKELPPVKEGDDPRVFLWGFTEEGNPNLAHLEEGTLASAALQLNGESVIRVTLRLPKARADLSPADLVKNEDAFGVDQNFDGAPVPQVDEDCKVGNARGAQRSASGKAKADGKPLWIRFYFVTLQKQLFEISLVAHNDWQQKEKDWWKNVVDGFKWDDTKAGVRGPVATPFATASEARGNGWSDFGKEKKFTGSVTYTKPAAFGALKADGEDGWIFAGEARKPSVYLFVGIRRFDNKLYGQARERKDPDSLIDDFENDWKNGVDDAVTRPKNGKTNRKPESFRGARGSTYYFTGKKGGVPFAERGWVVTVKGYVYHFRAQFGGPDAENVFAPEWKDFSSSIKFE